LAHAGPVVPFVKYDSSTLFLSACANTPDAN
jgi:hypothetical protein